VASKELKTFTAQTPKQWRAWLAKHHESESEVWLVFFKNHTGRPSIAYMDALDEALCFGWIDSLVRRLDEDRYARKFTPRKPDSRWSPTNRKRYAELAASGRLHPAGMKRAPTDRGYDPRPSVPSRTPDYILARLKKHPSALRYFETLAPSHQKRYFMWIDMAKRDETKARRLDEAVRLLSAKQPLGLK
jgi:uncharacterized protein YdeI (YjbR/CyaY-like superfamily)